jgi:CheY-like chemotaxis protein
MKSQRINFADEINQKVLSRHLQLAGFQTAVALHGLECLKILESATAMNKQFDAILLDLEMPVLSGLEAASEIRKREAAGELRGHTPIIAVTGNARREYIDKGKFELGEQS